MKTDLVKQTFFWRQNLTLFLFSEISCAELGFSATDIVAA